jgi:hypothetical protein
MFAQHSQPHVESSQPEDEPITEAPEPIAVGPEPTDPLAHDEKALTEEVARQVGWKVGDLVSGRVTNRQMINQRRVWATVSGWSEMVQVSVHDQSEWPAGSTIKCEYVQANSDGHLVFNSKEHGPKWKRRGSR